jgi:glycerol-3-phosphate acyltransferase PlsX
MPRIVVDAMGGDHAPLEIVRGSVDASLTGIDIVLVGDEGLIGPILKRFDADLPIVHTDEVIEMHQDPSRALREKKNASILVAAGLVENGGAEGLVSAGSTGATMAAAAFIIGRLTGVSRPAIASIFPTREVVIDIGANLDVRPEHLLQFAIMGSAVAEVYNDLKDPRVGLLNIGEEPGKGRALERVAFELLEDAETIHFVGNVEGSDLGRDTADVFVTDGFTGNILLKTVEGSARATLHLLLHALEADEYQEPLGELVPAFMELRQRIDPETTGGAHLVGTKAVVVIAHGSSSHRAVDNAIQMAAEGVERGLVQRTAAGLDFAAP